MTRLLTKTLKTLITTVNRLHKETILQCSTLPEQIQINPTVFENTNPVQRLLKVAIIGIPNAGKSTFINNLIDRKVCPTSAKVHTTRAKAQAIFTEEDAQIIFLDTPGLVSFKVKNKHNLERSFIKDSETCMEQSDIIGVIHDVSNSWTRERLDIKVIKLLEKYDRPSFLVLNKVDILKSKRKLLEITRLITNNCINGKPTLGKNSQIEETDNKSWPHFKEVFMVSSLTGSGLSEVKNYLINSAKPGEWLFPAEIWSDQTPEKIIVNTVKATLLDFLPQEIPYEMKPIIELYEANKDGIVNTVILVKCSSERVARLAAGASNGRLRQITETVQRDLQNVFKQYVRIQIVLQPPKENK